LTLKTFTQPSLQNNTNFCRQTRMKKGETAYKQENSNYLGQSNYP